MSACLAASLPMRINTRRTQHTQTVCRCCMQPAQSMIIWKKTHYIQKTCYGYLVFSLFCLSSRHTISQCVSYKKNCAYTVPNVVFIVLKNMIYLVLFWSKILANYSLLLSYLFCLLGTIKLHKLAGNSLSQWLLTVQKLYLLLISFSVYICKQTYSHGRKFFTYI